MIKVEHIKTHTISPYYSKNGSEGQSSKDVLVTDAKLVLVECKEVKHAILHSIINKNGKFYKPILISETEKIEVGDWMYWNGTTKQIIEATISFSPNDPSSPIVSKILALPEHFSPEQLQMIVDGKLKDGDKVLVECEKMFHILGNNSWQKSITKKEYQHCEWKEWDVIKLNPHITIYPVEEKNVYER